MLGHTLVAVTYHQLPKSIGVFHGKNAPTRSCSLPHSSVSARTEKVPLSAEGASITGTRLVLNRYHQRNDGTGTSQTTNPRIRDCERRGRPRGRARRLHASRKVEQHGIGQRIKRTPGVERLSIHLKAMRGGNEGEAPSHYITAVVHLEIS